MAATLGVRRHACAETLAVTAAVASAGVGKAVCVEPGDIHLKFNNDRKRNFIKPLVAVDRPATVLLSNPVWAPATLLK